jgi:hypothetical protein
VLKAVRKARLEANLTSAATAQTERRILEQVKQCISV